MADKYCSVENIKFLLHDVHRFEDVLKFSRYADFDKESVDLLIDSVKDLAAVSYTHLTLPTILLV